MDTTPAAVRLVHWKHRLPPPQRCGALSKPIARSTRSGYEHSRTQWAGAIALLLACCASSNRWSNDRCHSPKHCKYAKYDFRETIAAPLFARNLGAMIECQAPRMRTSELQRAAVACSPPLPTPTTAVRALPGSLSVLLSSRSVSRCLGCGVRQRWRLHGLCRWTMTKRRTHPALYVRPHSPTPRRRRVC